MDFVLYLDAAAMVLMAFFMISMLSRRQFDVSSNKLYFNILAVGFLCGLFDILASVPTFSRKALFGLNFVYLLLRSISALTFFMYGLSITGLWHKARSKKRTFWLIFAPLLLVLAVLVANFFQPLVYDYTPDGYVRYPWMIVSYVVSGLYGAGALAIVFFRRNRFRPAKIIAIVIALLIQVFAAVLQRFFGSVLVEVFALTIAALVLYSFVEKPEDFLDHKTQLHNLNSYAKQIRKNIDMGRPFSVILFHVDNHNEIYRVYDYNDAISYIQEVFTRLDSDLRRMSYKSHLYYVGQGTFALISYEPKKIEALTEHIEKSLASATNKRSDVVFPFHIRLCLAKCPDDFQNEHAILNFSRSFHELLDLKVGTLTKVNGEEISKTNLLLSLDKILNDAIYNNSFEMYYQPIYSFEKKRFNSAEALIRLYDKEYGFISPALFIPYAERTGKMLEIGEIILHKVLSFLASDAFQALHLDYVEINLSILQFLDANMVANINGFVEHYGVERSLINFELTETEAIAGNKTIEGNIFSLAKEGYRLSIDDFGVGYSNIARLTRLPISLLKIDKSLIDQMKDPSFVPVFQNWVHLLKDYGPMVLAEGVEDQSLLPTLESLGVNLIQGYCFSKPLPEADFIDFIHHSSK